MSSSIAGVKEPSLGLKDGAGRREGIREQQKGGFLRNGFNKLKDTLRLAKRPTNPFKRSSAKPKSGGPVDEACKLFVQTFGL